jgi:hypothetical protein
VADKKSSQRSATTAAKQAAAFEKTVRKLADKALAGFNASLAKAQKAALKKATKKGRGRRRTTKKKAA